MPEEYSEFLMDFVFKPYSNQLEVVANLFADYKQGGDPEHRDGHIGIPGTPTDPLDGCKPTATAAALRAKKALRRYSTTEHVDESVPEECVELESGLTEDIEGMHEELEAKWKACSELKEKIEKLLADTKASSS